MPALKDTDMFPFGKYGPHKGNPRMVTDVPANYLIWLWNQGLKNETMMRTPRGDLARYIEQNKDALQMEDPDSIMD